LASLASLGEHLVEPWNVVIAGAPNAGKSSLVNALAGYERSVVAPIAGTTRDIVRTRLALAGWPVTLSDTAGLRTSTDDLESLGIERARQELARADLVIWLKDSTQEPGADSEFEPAREIPGILVQSKIDLAPIRDARFLGISSTTGAGLEELMAEIVRRLVPVVPEPGEAVPFTPELAAAIRSAERAWHGDLESARQILQQCLDAIDPKS
jgi:tRNA modification GTPase